MPRDVRHKLIRAWHRILTIEADIRPSYRWEAGSLEVKQDVRIADDLDFPGWIGLSSLPTIDVLKLL